MKTLDEVIDAVENCDSAIDDCAHCAYFSEDCENLRPLRADVLSYLKKYRDNFDARNDQVERYQKAAKECEEILTDYVALKQYWAEQQANNPLTWDELRTMEGKPVWIEAESISVGVSPYWKDWYIIKSFSNDEFMHCNDGYVWAKETQGRMWQAYRKERG